MNYSVKPEKNKKQYNCFLITEIIGWRVEEKAICCNVFTVFYHSFCSFETYCKEKSVKNFLGRNLVVSRTKTGADISLFWKYGVVGEEA